MYGQRSGRLATAVAVSCLTAALFLGTAFGQPPPEPAARGGRVVVAAGPQYARNGEGSLVETSGGGLLYVYGAHAKKGDWDRGELRAIRSADRGATWSEPETILSDPRRSLFQASLARLPNGDVGLTHTSLADGKDAFKVFRRSADEGKTWSEPVRVSSLDHAYTTGPHDRLYALASGRLIALLHCNLKPDAKRQGGPLGSFAAISDDGGKTWACPPAADVLFVEANPLKKHEWGFWEPTLVEHAPGKLLMLGRTTTGKLHASRSEDDGTRWTAPAPLDVPHPIAPPVLTRVPGTETLVLLHNPWVDLGAGWHGGPRTELAYRLSRDGGKTWTFPVAIARSDDKSVWFDYPSVLWQGETLHILCRRIPVRKDVWTSVDVHHVTLSRAELTR